MNSWNMPNEKRSSEEQQTVEIFQKMRHDVVYMSEASVGELWYGVERSQRKASNQTRLNVLLSAVPPIPITRGVWELYGHTKAELSKIGKIVPDIDLLIASTSKYYKMVLVASDKHMQHLPSSFVRKNWAAGRY
ncbi:MAG: type II toxin-antitoxin system VapC family toxin [Planctomycetes bacterium]|nr:type II toxin-antitoxin system VapC family toxin [Planctomycetota bacterium]